MITVLVDRSNFNYLFAARQLLKGSCTWDDNEKYQN